MNYITVLLVSVALGIDAFSVAISIGLAGIRSNQILLVSGIVTLFHIFMPLIGLSMGTYLGKIAGPMASIIGAFVLISIGASTIWSNVKEMSANKGGASRPASENRVININSPLSLIIMAASVSLDALTVGFGLGTLEMDLFLTVITMGIVAGLMTIGGLVSGRTLNNTFGDKAEIIGGLILVLIGIKFLVW